MTDLAYPLAAIRDDGKTILAHTPEEAMGFHELRPAESHVDVWFDYEGRIRRNRNAWIVRDDHGRVVTKADLPERVRKGLGWRERRHSIARYAADRGLPIPGSGGRNRQSTGYRSFAANISMRGAESWLDDDLEDWDVVGELVCRRRAAELPQVWDDVAWRANRRCWKDYRGTQWRDRA